MAGNALGGSRERDDEYVRTHLEPLFGAPLTSEHRNDLDAYLCELRAWGARLDLVAPRDQDEFLDLALWDAAVVAREEALRGRAVDRIVDVGSGGGAPGIPLAIFLSALRGGGQVTLVEPRTKRVSFLRTVAGRLRTAELEVVRARSDELPEGGYDVAISRATLAPEEWLVEGGRLARGAVWVLLARGQDPTLARWSVDRALDYAWPLGKQQRRALRFARG